MVKSAPVTVLTGMFNIMEAVFWMLFVGISKYIHAAKNKKFIHKTLQDLCNSVKLIKRVSKSHQGCRLGETIGRTKGGLLQ